MQTKSRLLLLALGSALCATANARHTVADGWTGLSSGSGLTATVTGALPYNTLNSAAPDNGSPITLTGVTSLSFSTGTSTPGYQIDTLVQENTGEVEYLWSNPGFLQEQVVILPMDASSNYGAQTSFGVSFGYDDGAGGPSETATLTVNGVEYQAKDPAALDFTTIGTTSVNEAVLPFQNGVLQNASDYLGHGWTQVTSSGGGGGGGGGSVSAPEIDPASAGSALTLFAGGLAIVLAGRRRKLASPRTAV